MPKLDRWIVASKMIEVLDKETLQSILNLNGQIGGGWCQIHQHISVTPENKEKIEKILNEKGFNVSSACSHKIMHPECFVQGTHHPEL